MVSRDIRMVVMKTNTSNLAKIADAKSMQQPFKNFYARNHFNRIAHPHVTRRVADMAA